MENRMESPEIITGGIEEYLNLAESGLNLFKMKETFSMDGALNLESIRIALLNIRKLLSVLEIMASKETVLIGEEKYCNLVEFIKRVIYEIKIVHPAVAEKIELVDETFEPMYKFNTQKMQILVYNIVRIFILGTTEQKIKLKLKIYETDKDILMEFRGEGTVLGKITEWDKCMFYVVDKVTEVMNLHHEFKTQKNVTKCTIKLPKQKEMTAIAREDAGEIEIDKNLAEIYFSDL